MLNESGEKELNKIDSESPNCKVKNLILNDNSAFDNEKDSVRETHSEGNY